MFVAGLKQHILEISPDAKRGVSASDNRGAHTGGCMVQSFNNFCQGLAWLKNYWLGRKIFNLKWWVVVESGLVCFSVYSVEYDRVMEYVRAWVALSKK